MKSKFISPSDPAAQCTGVLRGPAFFAYATNYLIDTDNAITVDVEGTRVIRQAEVGTAQTMIEPVMDCFELYPAKLAAIRPMARRTCWAGWPMHKGIEPHIPVFGKSKRDDGTFSREDFNYDRLKDRYIYPAGKDVKRYRLTCRLAKAKLPKDGLYRYRAKKGDCERCSLKGHCGPKEPSRKVLRKRLSG